MATQRQVITEGFQNVTQTTDPDFYIRFLDDVDTNESAQDYRRRMLDLINAQEGDHILDVGCGVGHQVKRLAQLVGSTGRVEGVDMSETLIAVARRRSGELDLPIGYHVGKAYPLEYSDETFDICWSERVFMFLEDPQQALAEMIRVLRPGGRVAVQDLDLDAFIVDVPDQGLTRRIVHFLGDSMTNGWMGRQLPTLFKNAGLTDIAVVPHLYILTYSFHNLVFRGIVDKAQEAGVGSEAEATRWWNHLEKAADAGRFLSVVPGFIVFGRKP